MFLDVCLLGQNETHKRHTRTQTKKSIWQLVAPNSLSVSKNKFPHKISLKVSLDKVEAVFAIINWNTILVLRIASRAKFILVYIAIDMFSLPFLMYYFFICGCTCTSELIALSLSIYFSFLKHPPKFMSPLVIPGEVCQFGFRRSFVLSAQWMPGSVCQLSEHQRRSVGHIAQHPPRSAGEQHGPQRGTMSELQLCSTVSASKIIFIPMAIQEMNNVLLGILGQNIEH